MNKYAYLDELRSRIDRMSQYAIDNAVNDYSNEITKMLDEEWDWRRIQEAIGTPKEAAKRILNGRPIYVSPELSPKSQYERGYYAPENDGYNRRPQKQEKKGGFWKLYFIFGLITIPLTIALFAVVISLCAAAVGLTIGGAAAIIYSVIIGITAASFVVFLTYGGAALLVLGIGLLMLWVVTRLFQPVKALFSGRKNA